MAQFQLADRLHLPLQTIKDMTLEEELIEYLRFILEIPDSQISNIIGTYNDYAKKAQME